MGDAYVSPVWPHCFICGDIIYKVGRHVHDRCVVDAEPIIKAASNLAACLREAAGLCHEFERGWWSAKYAADISPNPVQNCLLDWRPGCGRVAPGFEGK